MTSGPSRNAAGRLPTVLYVTHNHPDIRPGGSEIYAHELFKAIRRAGQFAPIFLARVGPPQSRIASNPGTRLAIWGEEQDEFLFHTCPDEFDRLTWSSRDKAILTGDWRSFLQAVQPDLVHFQHSMLLGYDMLEETRNTLPSSPIVYTLHEFMPICHNYGHMIRTGTAELCNEATPRRCHQCFPEVDVQSFFLRERFIRCAFELVDRFVVPSEDAARRYIRWGIPTEKINVENYGRLPATPMPDPPHAGRRKRIGFFGQLVAHKGIDVLLEAMKILGNEGDDVHLTIRGANLDFQRPEFKELIYRLLAETEGSVDFGGSFTQREVPGLLSSVDWVIVPSLWWETGPLVIHEAFAHHRPVICSNIGSMRERVIDGVTGLHFRVRDPRSLAGTIRRAVNDPQLWDTMRSNIHDPHTMDDHMSVMTNLYEVLLSARTSAATAV